MRKSIITRKSWWSALLRKAPDADLVYGKIGRDDSLSFVSNMGENGVIFSDGIIDDAIDFTAGMEVKVSLAERVGRLVAR